MKTRGIRAKWRMVAGLVAGMVVCGAICFLANSCKKAPQYGIDAHPEWYHPQPYGTKTVNEGFMMVLSTFPGYEAVARKVEEKRIKRGKNEEIQYYFEAIIKKSEKTTITFNMDHSGSWQRDSQILEFIYEPDSIDYSLILSFKDKKVIAKFETLNYFGTLVRTDSGAVAGDKASDEKTGDFKWLERSYILEIRDPITNVDEKYLILKGYSAVPFRKYYKIKMEE